MQLMTNTKVCADDFGLAQEINQAVFDLCNKGVVNATSVMVDAEFLDQDTINKLKELRDEKKIELGLHLNFTHLFVDSAQPKELVRSLRSYMFSFKALTATKKEAYSAEIQRQQDKFVELFDFLPDFFDSHQHVHVLNGIREVFVDHMVVQVNENYRPWIRVTNHEHSEICATTIGGRLKSIYLNHYGAKLCKLLHQKYLEQKEFSYLKIHHLLGLYNFENIKYSTQFLEWYTIANQVKKFDSVIMVHPATYPPTNDPIALARAREYQALININLNQTTF